MRPQKTSLEALKEAGITPTLPRMAILDHLKSCHTHPTADSVYLMLRDELPTLSKTTVYNTLRVFSERKLVRMLHLGDEAHFDGDMDFHAHFLCVRCGAIFNVPMARMATPQDLENVLVQDQQVTYRGVCTHCQERDSRCPKI